MSNLPFRSQCTCSCHKEPLIHDKACCIDDLLAKAIAASEILCKCGYTRGRHDTHPPHPCHHCDGVDGKALCMSFEDA